MKLVQLQELVDSYWPNEHVLEAVTSISLVGVVGATASGKTTVMEEAAHSRATPHLQIVLSDVSRTKRPGEQDGRDYYFRERPEMIDGIRKGIYVQVALSPGGDIYTTRPASFPQEGVGLIAMFSHAVKTFRSLPFKNMRTAFVVPESYELWQKWLAKQAKDSGWDSHQLHSRLKEAKMSHEFALSDPWMRFVLNNEPAAAAKRLLQVARGEEPDNEDKARRLAGLHLTRLKKVG